MKLTEKETQLLDRIRKGDFENKVWGDNVADCIRMNHLEQATVTRLVKKGVLIVVSAGAYKWDRKLKIAS